MDGEKANRQVQAPSLSCCYLTGGLHSNILSRIQSHLNFTQVTLTPYHGSSSGFLPIPACLSLTWGTVPRGHTQGTFLTKRKKKRQACSFWDILESPIEETSMPVKPTRNVLSYCAPSCHLNRSTSRQNVTLTGRGKGKRRWHTSGKLLCDRNGLEYF